LADSVGLGKTFSALGIIKYYELRNKSVLVLSPKKIGENWLTFRNNVSNNILFKDRFRYDVLYHTDLSRESGYTNGLPLDRLNWGNYDLLVIDESHNFRNNVPRKDKESRYQKLMRKVIKEGVRTRLLMLSATPVNNRFNDLKNQLALAYEGNPENINQELRTQKGIEEIFRRAQAAFNAWSKLPLSRKTTANLLDSLDFDFFELLDSVTIARSRKHIQKYYDTSQVGPFPERLTPVSQTSALTHLPDVISYNDIFKELSKLSLAIYAPFDYILPSKINFYAEKYDTVVSGGGGSLKQSDREKSLQGLMRINLLKRLESSVDAFRITLSKILDIIDNNINRIDNYDAAQSSVAIDQMEFDSVNLDDDSWLDEDYNVGGTLKINLSDMDRLSWREDLMRDRDVLESMLSEMNKITPEHDAKLNELKEVIANKVKNPINPGNKKVLIFTAFADTAAYLYQNLSPYLKDNFGLDTAKVVGSNENKTTLQMKNDFHNILTCFSPRSKEKDLVMPDLTGEIDILIGTDCISEGQNLQDCDYLINYDIHWNPVRIIQRFGRIDRIGSTNSVIQLVNFWPNMTLDEYINLKERVESRMIIMDMTATGEDNVLSNQSSDLEYRKDQLSRLQNEVVDLDDMNTGVSITDLGLNDFRIDLVQYIKNEGDLSQIPLGLHAVVPAHREKEAPPGVIFILRNINSEVNINNQNRLHPFYLVYIDNEGQVVTNHLEVKKTLDILRLLCKGYSEPLPELYKPFNRETADGWKMDHYSRLLEDSIRSIIDVKEESDLDSLFSSGGTTALLNNIRGLEDFELISFIVVRPGDGNV